MLTEDERKREIQQWGIIYNIARQRRSLADLRYSPEERVIARVIEKVEKEISGLKGNR